LIRLTFDFLTAANEPIPSHSSFVSHRRFVACTLNFGSRQTLTMNPSAEIKRADRSSFSPTPSGKPGET
jgi:hypothetical protein